VDGRSRLSQNKKDIYKAKGQGFDVKILREVIRIPKKDQKDQKDRTRRSLCSTSTFSPQCGPPIRPAFARRATRAHQRLDPSASQLDRGVISLTAPGQMP